MLMPIADLQPRQGNVEVEAEIVDKGDNIYNLGSGHNYSIISLANMVADVYQERYNKSINIEIPENAAEPDITISFHFSIDKIKKLNYHPTSVMKEEIHNIFKLLEG